MKKQNGYEIQVKMSKPQRAAHFLDWNAKHSPGDFVAYNELLKAITGVGRMPQLKSQEVEHLRRNGYAIRKHLFEKYGRELVSLPGVGVRASIDDADVLKNVVPKKATRLQSARVGFIKTVSHIDQKNIPDTAEMRPLKGWLTHQVKDIMKQISDPSFERKLLPPSSETPPEK
jgi:hypothetical protein